MPKIIGLTGGIGSGKTTIAKYMTSRGIPVYIADQQAHKLTNKPKTLVAIKTVFGQQVFDQNVLNRKKLATIVFNDPEQLALLNAIIHPIVKLDFEKWLQKHASFDYVVKESAILFESKSYLDCDIIITIIAPLQLRIERIILRDKTTEEAVLLRINSQITDIERIDKSDYVIENSKYDISIMRVDEILKKLKIL